MSWEPGVTADVLKEAQLLDSELKWTIRTIVMPPLAAELLDFLNALVTPKELQKQNSSVAGILL